MAGVESASSVSLASSAPVTRLVALVPEAELAGDGDRGELGDRR